MEKEEKMDNKKKAIAVKTEVFSRIVGYYRPIEGWNVGKKEEFKDRNYLSAAKPSNTPYSRDKSRKSKKKSLR